MKAHYYDGRSGYDTHQRFVNHKCRFTNTPFFIGIRYRWFVGLCIGIGLNCCGQLETVKAQGVPFTYVSPNNGYNYYYDTPESTSGTSSGVNNTQTGTNSSGMVGSPVNSVSDAFDSNFTQYQDNTGFFAGLDMGGASSSGTTTYGPDGTEVGYSTTNGTMTMQESQNQARFELGTMTLLNDMDMNIQSGGLDFTQDAFQMQYNPVTHLGAGLGLTTTGDGSVPDFLVGIGSQLGLADPTSHYNTSFFFQPALWGANSYNGIVNVQQQEEEEIGQTFLSATLDPFVKDYLLASWPTIRTPTMTSFSPDGTATIAFPFMSISAGGGGAIAGSSELLNLTVPTTGAGIISTVFNAAINMCAVVYVMFRVITYVKRI